MKRVMGFCLVFFILVNLFIPNLVLGKDVNELASFEADEVNIGLIYEGDDDFNLKLKNKLKEDSSITQKESSENFQNKNEIQLEKFNSENNNPETINIEKSGKYMIDIKGLLEEEPIIIQKDGSYTIHLPSIFKMLDKEKRN